MPDLIHRGATCGSQISLTQPGLVSVTAMLILLLWDPWCENIHTFLYVYTTKIWTLIWPCAWLKAFPHLFLKHHECSYIEHIPITSLNFFYFSASKTNTFQQQNNPSIMFTYTVYPIKWTWFCCDLFCCGSVFSIFTWCIYLFPSGLLHWHWGNHMIAPVSVK